MDVAGGVPINLVDVDGIGGAWAPSGDILFTASTGPVERLPAGGGKVEPVTTLDTSLRETAHRYPFLLPDGRHFLLSRPERRRQLPRSRQPDLGRLPRRGRPPGPSSRRTSTPSTPTAISCSSAAGTLGGACSRSRSNSRAPQDEWRSGDGSRSDRPLRRLPGPRQLLGLAERHPRLRCLPAPDPAGVVRPRGQTSRGLWRPGAAFQPAHLAGRNPHRLRLLRHGDPDHAGLGGRRLPRRAHPADLGPEQQLGPGVVGGRLPGRVPVRPQAPGRRLRAASGWHGHG